MASKSKKTKRALDSSDSDSGPDDRNVITNKKTQKVESAADKEPMFPISKTRFVKVREFRGKVLVDIREYYNSDGELKPGKKGICLSAEQYQALKDALPQVDEALKNF